MKMPILWPGVETQTAREELDGLVLRQVYERQLRVSALIVQMAQQLYAARGEWIGGGTIPWDDLGVRRRADYMQEIERLVKGEQ
jgi:hypothetical protein